MGGLEKQCNDDCYLFYTVSQKDGHPILTIISLNINRFSKFSTARKSVKFATKQIYITHHT